MPLTAADQEQPRSFQVATLSAMAEVLSRRASVEVLHRRSSGGLFRTSKSLDRSSADGRAVPPPPPERTSVRQGALRLVRASCKFPPQCTTSRKKAVV